MSESIGTLILATPRAAAASLRELRKRRIHPHFAGYLCLLHTAAVTGSTQEMRVNFRQFFDEFLAYGEASRVRPYLNPFSNLRRNRSIYFNRNPAGSYSPKSIRPGYPLASVVSAHGGETGARYTLVEAHPSAALEHLLYGQKLPVVPLSIFLYRDHGIRVEEDGFDYQSFVAEFRTEFGLDAPGDGAVAFAELFETDASYLRGMPLAESVGTNGSL